MELVNFMITIIRLLVLLMLLIPVTKVYSEIIGIEGTRQALIQADFPEHLIPIALCIIKFESNFNTKAHNVNPNKTIDTGLFQVNSAWYNKCNTNQKLLQNPIENIKCAKKIMDEQGLKAWMAYTSHKTICDTFSNKIESLQNNPIIILSSKDKM